MKSKRQSAIMEIISSNDIENQEELINKLSLSGFNVTQATVSRDIKELRIAKTLTKSGKYKYALPDKDEKDISDKFASILTSSIVSTDNANNIVVIKCYAGMAQGACAAIDAMQWDGLVGTLAGDDVIFALFKDVEKAKQMMRELKY